MQPALAVQFSARSNKYNAAANVAIEDWGNFFGMLKVKPASFPHFCCDHDPEVKWSLSLSSQNDRVVARVKINQGWDDMTGINVHVVSATVRLRGSYGLMKISEKDHSFDVHLTFHNALNFIFTREADTFWTWTCLEDVRIECDIQYVNGYSIEKISAKASIASRTVDATLPENLLAMMESGEGTNVTFCVEGAQIPAHKHILSARSEYFRRMFDSGLKEATTGVVDVKDANLDAFKDMLRFIYSGILPDLTEESALKLLHLAAMYCLDPLKEACAGFVASLITVDNACDVLMVAAVRSCPNLKKKCIETIKKDLKTVAKQNIWKELKKDLSLVSEIMDAISE